MLDRVAIVKPDEQCLRARDGEMPKLEPLKY
jgi:hypothetical protein